MIVGKFFLDYTDLFSPNDFQVNDSIIYKYFKNKCDRQIRKSSIQTEKNKWKKKSFFRRHNNIIIRRIRSIKKCVGLSIKLTTYFTFCFYWLCFNICICFIFSIPLGITSSAVNSKLNAIEILISDDVVIHILAPSNFLQ